MKSIYITALATLFAQSAIAHDGAHIHPHGYTEVVVFIALAILSAFIFWRAK